MPSTARAVVHHGKIELLEPLELPEGAEVLVTPLLDEDARFWASASQTALDKVRGNSAEDCCEQLLDL